MFYSYAGVVGVISFFFKFFKGSKDSDIPFSSPLGSHLIMHRSDRTIGLAGYIGPLTLTLTLVR